MAEVQQPVSGSSKTPQWDIDLIFSTLGDASRRRILLSLAKTGPLSADRLHSGPKQLLSTTLKQLTSLREAGLVEKKENPSDGRKPLYYLSPSVPLTQTETGVFLDFGFCTLRF